VQLATTLAVLRRRWWISSLLLVGTIAAAVAAPMVLPSQHKVEGEVLFLASPASSEQTGRNPFLRFDSTMSITAEIIAQRLTDAETVRELRADGPLGQFEVVFAPGMSGPVLNVKAFAEQPQLALETLDAVFVEVDEQLDTLQADAGAPQPTRIRSVVLSQEDEASQVLKPRIRLVIVIVALGTGLSLAMPFVLEAFAGSRRPRAPGIRPPAPRREPKDGPGSQDLVHGGPSSADGTASTTKPAGSLGPHADG
jgi:hypothetical protein